MFVRERERGLSSSLRVVVSIACRARFPQKKSERIGIFVGKLGFIQSSGFVLCTFYAEERDCVRRTVKHAITLFSMVET